MSIRYGEPVMKKFVVICALALAATALAQQQASAWGGGGCAYNFGFGVNFTVWCKPVSCGPCGGGGGGCAPLAPWYTYWPYEAHFQSPAPLGHYPYWPTQFGSGGPTMHMPTPQGSAGMAPSGFVPAGYSQAPSYWYAR
jgi:hypothetical protein